MKDYKSLKRFFLLLPLAIWCFAIGFLYLQNSRIDKLIQDPEGMIIGSGNNHFTVGVNRTVENEVATYVVTVRDNGGATVLEKVFSADHDMFGFSLVKAMQTDSDAEPEVVAWGNNIREGASFILDFSGNELQQRPFADLSNEAMKNIEDYKRINVEYPFLLFLLFIATPAYYFGYYIVCSIIKALSGDKKPDISNRQ